MAAMVDVDTSEISNTTPVLDESSCNAPRPSILHLPPELLSLVVIFAAESEPPRSPVSSEDRENAQMRLYSRAFWDPIVQGGSLGWIRLCHVCRLWRQHICKGMPLLWAQAVGCFRFCGAFEEMLRRAGNSVPLSVQSGYREDLIAVSNPAWMVVESPVQSWSQSDNAAFRKRVRHVRIVDMQVVAGHHKRDPSQAILDDMMELECLEVYYLCLNSFDVSNTKLLGPDTSVLRAPNLRVIRFRNYFIPWTSPGLTELSIFVKHFGLPPKTFYDAIRLIAPTIETLVLEGCLPLDIELLEHNFDPHTLPRLGFLRVSDMDDRVGDFLKRIRFPPTATLHLALDITVPVEQLDSVIEEALLRLGSDFLYRSMVFTITDVEVWSVHDRIQLGFFRAINDPRSSIDNEAFDFAIGIQCSGGGRDCMEYLAAVETALVRHKPTIWHDLVSLNLNLPLWEYASEIHEILPRFTNLRQLRLLDALDDSTGAIAWKAPFSRPLPQYFSSRLDILCIAQHAKWSPGEVFLYCAAWAAELEDGASSEQLSAGSELSLTELLRIEFIERSEVARINPQGDFESLFSNVADEVELRFL